MGTEILKYILQQFLRQPLQEVELAHICGEASLKGERLSIPWSLFLCTLWAQLQDFVASCKVLCGRTNSMSSSWTCLISEVQMAGCGTSARGKQRDTSHHSMIHTSLHALAIYGQKHMHTTFCSQPHFESERLSIQNHNIPSTLLGWEANMGTSIYCTETPKH